jgi:hypothetical protein
VVHACQQSLQITSIEKGVESLQKFYSVQHKKNTSPEFSAPNRMVRSWPIQPTEHWRRNSDFPTCRPVLSSPHRSTGHAWSRVERRQPSTGICKRYAVSRG